MNVTQLAFAISATLFGVLFLGAVIAFGGDLSRNVAIASAFLACASQFLGQDPKGWRISIYIAYGAFVSSLFAFFALVFGH